MAALLSISKVDFAHENYEVLVIDNGPKTEAKVVVDAMNRSDRRIHYFREPVIGLHNARHRGAREAKGEILVYVDDDVSVKAGWLRAIVAPFSDARVACAGGKVSPFWENCQPPQWWSNLPRDYLSLLDYGDERLELQWPQCVNGCNMAVRRTVLFQVGGFHPDGYGDARLIWFRGDGETGLLKKIYSSGYRIVYEPAACLNHHISASRLTPGYFFWRAFIEGISDSYTGIRDSRSRTRILLRAFYSYFHSAYHYCRARLKPRNKILALCDASYWYGRGQHQLRAVLSHKLYRHVVQETYL